MITIYGKDNCGFCTKAKNLCDIRQLEYAYVDVGLTQNLNELKEKLPNARSVPQIWVNDTHVGGYNELVQHIEETNYNGTGYTL
jgi:glutaredoxin